MNDKKVESCELRVESSAGDAAASQLSTTRSQPVSPGQRAWRRFKRNRAAVVSAWFLLALLVVIVAWPLLLKIAGGDFARLHNPDQLSDRQFAPPTGQHWRLLSSVKELDPEWARYLGEGAA